MKNNFQKILLVLSVTLFAFSCFAFVFLYRKTNDNNQKAESVLTEWTNETYRRDDIMSLEHSLQKISDARTQLETHFAKSSDVVPFLDMIEKLAPKTGSLAQIDSVDTSGGSTGLIVGFSVSGSFDSIYKFITLLENSQYELEFLSMDIHSMTASNTSVDSGSAQSKAPVKNAVPKWQADFKIQLLSFIP
jgi:cell division protein FtsB